MEQRNPLEELKALLRYRKTGYRELAHELNIQLSTFARKINQQGNSEFSKSEIQTLAAYLNLGREDIFRYFFPDMVA